MLREISDREYERITNTFLWIYHTPCIRITDVKNSCESFTEVKDLHVFVTSAARILYRCDKYVRIFHTGDRLVWISHSNESVTRVKNSHVFFTHVKYSNEFFTYVTNTCELFTRLNLDICEKLVPIKISKFSHIPKCDVFERIIHSMWKIRSVNIKVQQSLVMSNSCPRDGIFNPHSTTIKDSYMDYRVVICIQICPKWKHPKRVQYTP